MSEDDSSIRVRYWSHMQLKRNLRRGDHIYVWRPGWIYQHHGIYTGEEGDKEVIHVSGRSPPTARVCATSISDFLQGGTLRLVSYSDQLTRGKRRGTAHTTPSLPAEEVLRIAREYLDNPEKWGPYSLTERNCEDFAYFCKTGKIKSSDSTVSDVCDELGQSFRTQMSCPLHQVGGPLAQNVINSLTGYSTENGDYQMNDDWVYL